ncbi:hypothetical protein SBA4_3630031 [Candidatus Sulfopaludibacter sp. SbA4]|nr:hypothetical protein SBA4_3630031 [Candidatus Sulfopaludibacter sp. SbA4]
MEYKIFGPSQQPPYDFDDFKDDLEAFFRLDEQQRDAIANWFLAARSYNLYEPEFPSIIAASTLLPEQFRQTADVVRHLLNSWQRYGLELQDIERDLLLLGFGQEELAILSNLLARLASIKERVWLDEVKDVQHDVGLPTIDDVNIVWDARPLFGSAAYDHYAVDGDDLYRRFFGLTYLATVEITTADNYGQTQRTAIHLTEEDFERLLRAMKRANEQLAILKERTNAVVPDTKDSKAG